MRELPDLLVEAGLDVRLLDGYEQPAKPGYTWLEGGPHGVMWHHTATPTYVPNRDKANVWIGLGRHTTQRLYQAGEGSPVVVIANLEPAPISSGLGLESVLREYVQKDVELERRATQPGNWYGNRYYINVEVVLDGVGTKLAPDVFDACVTFADVVNELKLWTPARHITHSMHTSRKVDLWDGTYANSIETMKAMRKEMGQGMTDKEWFDTLREKDIEQAGAIGVLDASEVSYWVDVKRGVAVDDPADLRRAFTVRAPLYT